MAALARLLALLDRQVCGKRQTDGGKEHGQCNGITWVVRSRHIVRWQGGHVAPMLNRAEDHARRPDEHQGDANDIRDVVLSLRVSVSVLLNGKEAQKQAKPRNNESECHDRETRAHPSQERPFGGEEDPGIVHQNFIPRAGLR